MSNPSNTAVPDNFTRKELLKECWTEQRQEITYRRDREQLIFQTTASLWIGLVGSIVVNDQSANPILRNTTTCAKIVMSVVILFVAALVTAWIKKQRDARLRSQNALTNIQEQSGCFAQNQSGKSVLPSDFRTDWGKSSSNLFTRLKRGSFKYLGSWLLPLIVIFAIWWVPIQKTQETSTGTAGTNAPPSLSGTNAASSGMQKRTH